MIQIDLAGQTALITGGTLGIGRAAALQLARSGARVYVTCKWGTADLDELYTEFSDAGAEPPVVIEADVSIDEDTDRLLEEIAKKEERIDIFVSNVGFAPVVKSLDDYVKRSFLKTVEYSSWPIIEYTKRMQGVFGQMPARVIGISSDGPDHYYLGYDYVSAAKALLEHFSRYLSVHLLAHGGRCNVIRFGTVKTPSFEAIFGQEYFDFAEKEGVTGDLILEPEECGKAVLALCSGLLDGVNGQTLTVDYGLPFQDNLMMRYLRMKDTENNDQN
jgi:NAD(P)-dependent dehydrogenase (short-subunit alcohol dehydrogenase family)